MDAVVVLEYLKVVLSTPVLVVLVILIFMIMFRPDIKALMTRVAKVKFPGGEIETSQLDKIKEEGLPQGKLSDADTKEGTATDDHPIALPDGGKAPAVFAAERAKATLWEYRYLNLFLVPNSQRVLDWLAAATAPVTVSLFQAWWLPNIPDPKERAAILQALESHELISIVNDVIEVTPKGRDYLQCRGPVPKSAA